MPEDGVALALLCCLFGSDLSSTMEGADDRARSRRRLIAVFYGEKTEEG